MVAGLGVLTPRFSSLDSLGNHREMRFLFRKALTTASILSFFGVAGAVVAVRPFVRLWVGPGFSGSAAPFWVLACGYAFAMAQNPGISAMYALKKHHYFARVSLVEALANVALSIALVGRLGIVGVAIGTTVPMLVVKIVIQPIYTAKILGISLRAYWTPLVPFAAVGGVAVAAGMMLAHRMADSSLWVQLAVPLAGACLVLVVGLFAAWLLRRRMNLVFPLEPMPPEPHPDTGCSEGDAPAC